MQIFKGDNKSVKLAENARNAELQKKQADHQARVDAVVGKIVDVLIDNHIKLSELQKLLQAVMIKINKVEGEWTVKELLSIQDETIKDESPEEDKTHGDPKK